MLHSDWSIRWRRRKEEEDELPHVDHGPLNEGAVIKIRKYNIKYNLYSLESINVQTHVYKFSKEAALLSEQVKLW